MDVLRVFRSLVMDVKTLLMLVWRTAIGPAWRSAMGLAETWAMRPKAKREAERNCIANGT